MDRMLNEPLSLCEEPQNDCQEKWARGSANQTVKWQHDRFFRYPSLDVFLACIAIPEDPNSATVVSYACVIKNEKKQLSLSLLNRMLGAELYRQLRQEESYARIVPFVMKLKLMKFV